MSAPADDLGRSIDRLAEEHGFSGVVRVDDADRAAFSRAYGLAHRGHRVPNTLATRFAIASGTKGADGTVVGYTSRGAWPIARLLRDALTPDSGSHALWQVL